MTAVEFIIIIIIILYLRIVGFRRHGSADGFSTIDIQYFDIISDYTFCINMANACTSAGAMPICFRNVRILVQVNI